MSNKSNSDTIRTVIGFAVIGVILIGWQLLFRPKPRQQPAAQPRPVAVESVATPAPEPEPAPRPVPVLAPAAAAPETSCVLENDDLRVELTNVGGAIRSVRLKRHDVELVPDGKRLLGLELLTDSGPLSLAATPMAMTVTDSTAAFEATAGPVTVRRSYAIAAGCTLSHRLTVGGAAGFAFDAMSGIEVTEANRKEALGYFHVYGHSGKKAKGLTAGKLKSPQPLPDSADWFALRSKYFAVAAVARGSLFDSLLVTPLADGRLGCVAVTRGAGEFAHTLYLGPVENSRLRPLGVGLDAITGQGWTRPIEIAMMWLLHLLYSAFRNWGVAIMVFAILMKAALWPLSRTQTRQMRQMQLLQPKLNELKAKYKDDAQKLNAETMQLYKLYKINPLSGCLPMVLQLPIFWALYAVLRNAIEMRGAHFVLWLRDLSQPDVLFGHLPSGIPFVGGYAVGLLPVLMGVSFIGQNLITSTDKKNWAMTIIFPVFITAIFLNLPSGLQLYWFMYNILSIVESLIAIKGGNLWRKKSTRTLSAQANPPRT
jgi:YidC/Oxa1 family membrane protein insertase